MRRIRPAFGLLAVISVALVACAPVVKTVDVLAPLTPAEESILRANLANTSWSFSSRQDSFTDSERRLLSTPATDAPSNIYGDATLYVRCNISGPGDGDLDLYVVSGTYLSSNGVRVDYRLDDETAVLGRRWIPSTDGDSAFAIIPDIRALVEGMRTAVRLQVRLYDYRGTAYDYSFRVKGFGSVYNLLRCQPAS